MEPDAGAEEAKAKEGTSDASEAAALFCLIALRSGLLSAARVDEALATALASGKPVAEVCVAQGWLTESQARVVLHHVGAPEAPAPTVDSEDAREFARLVAMKRLAGDGQLDACRDLQKDLAGGVYGRLSELLVRQASRRSAATRPSQERAAGMPTREEAFELYVKLKQAVQRGDVDEATVVAGRLRGDPEFGRLAETQLNRAFTRRAVSDARRTGGEVTRCHTCGTPALVGEKCSKCLDSPTAPSPEGHPSG